MDSFEADSFYDFEAIWEEITFEYHIPNQENIFHDREARRWEENPTAVSSPFELLKVYGPKTKRLLVEGTVKEKISDHHSSSTLATVKLARSRLQEMKSKNVDVLSILSKTHLGSQSGELTFEEEIDLGMALLASAEQVAKKRFLLATKLLNWCQSSSSKTGTPLQRIVYYFSEALQRKMDQEWGFIKPNEMTEEKDRKSMDVLQTMITLLPDRMSCEQEFFTSLVCQFTSIQSILENVASAKRIHLIDFRIKNGSPWTILIQALAVRYECPIELLKITAIGTSNELMEETGRHLSAFAETMNVPFAYNVVLSDLKEINKEMFEIEADETLAIYSSMSLWTLLAWPDELENLLCFIKGLNPCLMVTHESESSLNSPDFVERFTQALFHFSCLFDGLLMNFKNHPFRKLSEEIHYRDRIRNTITCDGTERTYRHENASFWRSLFVKCGFVEAELSPSTLSQANFLLERSVNQSHRQLQTDGKCIIAGWGGTPLEFVSTWKLEASS